jgi:hypothetical protein
MDIRRCTASCNHSPVNCHKGWVTSRGWLPQYRGVHPAPDRDPRVGTCLGMARVRPRTKSIVFGHFAVTHKLVLHVPDRPVVGESCPRLVTPISGRSYWRRAQFSSAKVAHRKLITRMLNSSWCRIRRDIDLPQVRVHDLKHTFGRRLRAAGVSFEDRQDLLGHRSGRMTTHYSAAELTKLIDAANSVCERAGNKPELVVLRRLSVS